MIRTALRAAACAALCLSVTGCGSVAGQILGGLLAATAAEVVNVAVASAIRGNSGRDRARRTTRTATPVITAPAYPDQEDPALHTCAAKRAEFISVYGRSRKVPPQLECTEEGEFGAPVVYGGPPDHAHDPAPTARR